MNLYRALGVCVCIGIIGNAQAADLVYAISYQETNASRRAHPEKYNMFAATTDQKVEMTRGSLKTEIYAVSLDGKQRLLFSDAGPRLELAAPPNNSLPVVAAGRAYVAGKELGWKSTPTPGVYSTPRAIYELSLDGSNKYRKIAEVKDEFSSGRLFVNYAGTKLGYLTSENGKYSMSIYDVASGKPLNTWSADSLFRSHCPDCIEQGVGWLSDGRLFIAEELGDEDSISPKSHNAPGTYLVSAEGVDEGRIDTKLGHFLASSSNGNYFFVRSGQKPASMSIVRLNPYTKEQKELLLQAQRFNYVVSKLSPSGTYLAFTEESVTSSYQSEFHLSFKDLGSGKENEVFVLNPTPRQSSEPNRSLTVLGWLE